jgi:hypothetical protein
MRRRLHRTLHMEFRSPSQPILVATPFGSALRGTNRPTVLCAFQMHKVTLELRKVTILPKDRYSLNIAGCVASSMLAKPKM